MAGVEKGYAALAERIERLELQNRVLKRAMAVLLALCGVGLLIGQNALRNHAHHVERLEHELLQEEEGDPQEEAQGRASSNTAVPR